MTCFIATLKIKLGYEADFERLQAELSALTHAQEPGTLVYDILRSPTARGTYVVYARFKDETSFQLHQGTAFHERLVPPIMATLAADMELQFYDFIA